MDFIAILKIFRAFLNIHTTFRTIRWECNKDTLKYDPHFMLVWSRLLKTSKPLLKKTTKNLLVITCLYLTYSLQGIEINYPLRPFLKYVAAADADSVYSLAMKIINNHFSMSILKQQ